MILINKQKEKSLNRYQDQGNPNKRRVCSQKIISLASDCSHF
ncbi:unnamed protein product [Paramecium sonneborni]|uniref:Uncharacterized protein n=1 Tax=Paramecium sonneborni TaxID=65129 RepID=A0A8S1LYW5_9CILI|nr:unnamed protein product [Paramecium sonneborni]